MGRKSDDFARDLIRISLPSYIVDYLRHAAFSFVWHGSYEANIQYCGKVKDHTAFFLFSSQNYMEVITFPVSSRKHTKLHT